MSLSEVASAVAVSAATLSRIETEKQSVDVALLLAVARVLHVSPAAILGENGDGAESERSLVDALATLPSEKRAKVIAAAATRRANRSANEPIHNQLDALLATLDIIRGDLSELQRQVRRRRK